MRTHSGKLLCQTRSLGSSEVLRVPPAKGLTLRFLDTLETFRTAAVRTCLTASVLQFIAFRQLLVSIKFFAKLSPKESGRGSVCVKYSTRLVV